MNKICPLISRPVPGPNDECVGWERCQRDSCAWWNKQWGACAMRIISGGFNVQPLPFGIKEQLSGGGVRADVAPGLTGNERKALGKMLDFLDEALG